MRPLLLLAVLSVLISGCGQEKKTDPRPQPQKNFVLQERFSDPVEILQAPGEEGIYVLTTDSVFTVNENEKSLWLRFGPRSVWSMIFSPRWQWDRLFYVFYKNRVGASILSEGAEAGSGGEIRRKVLQLPASDGGGLAWQSNNLLLSDRRRLLRINPFLQEEEPYSVPKNNPRGEETWAALPPGRWSSFDLEKQRVVWGESKQGSFLWQSTSSVLRASDADWESSCAIRGGAPWRGGLLFSCADDLLLWQDNKMQVVAEDQPEAVDLLAVGDELWLLSPDGALLQGEVPR